MVKATSMSKEKVAWGEIEVFHSVEYAGERFRIHEPVIITTTNSESFAGEIVSITRSNLDFMTKERHFKLLEFKDIASISYQKN